MPIEGKYVHNQIWELLVRSAQKKLISKLIAERATMLDDPFNLALGIACEARCPAARYISTLDSFDQEDDAAALLTRVRQSTRTKFRTYAECMNPDLTVHDMYTSTDTIKIYRITATRVQLSSHNLAVKRGHWSRQPREERLCECGAIQDEQHMAAYCPRHSPHSRKPPADRLYSPGLVRRSPCAADGPSHP
ncbi:hypothetical protein CAPTEDRAFT_214995 [Capitella teleta]|uniref:Uncharacterized protein n=1 Tax=Capitella teleta TaxID=283909 RepID=R7TM06_CAPTE|nr:hypothetical protein CAPTEDRAFT_214995 [Capitella teleta]|eukprot:ELT92135.1 hypothetical protein CAPTEDRAFT_214995 [Capitella teleta]